MNYEHLVSCFHQVEDCETSDFGLNRNEILCFRCRICMPNDVKLKQSVLWKTHGSPYTMHPDEDKMYMNL